jgi:hypothetical protein
MTAHSVSVVAPVRVGSAIDIRLRLPNAHSLALHQTRFELTGTSRFTRVGHHRY